MLITFLQMYEKEILADTENKTLKLAGFRPSSDQLKRGLPIFYKQLLDILTNSHVDIVKLSAESIEASTNKAKADKDKLSVSAGEHGLELMKLGYKLSDVVNAFGFMCQAITELAAKKNEIISPNEFNELNRCLDMAIASAVTEFQYHMNTSIEKREVEHIGFLAHELRNALTSVNLSFDMIKKGTVGFGGNTGKVLNSSLKRMQLLIDQSLTEVRLRVDPNTFFEKISLLDVVNQIALTAETEARNKDQILIIDLTPETFIVSDLQLIYSALSNLIQNAIKYTHNGGRIRVSSELTHDSVIIHVEDECGGLPDNKTNLFAPFEQQNSDRSGLGLGLTIAKRAVELNHGKISVTNRPSKGCVFNISLPLTQADQRQT